MIIVKLNPFNGKTYQWEIPVTQEQINDWQKGTKIQNAMPNIGPDQREFLMTGITPDQWEELFPEIHEIKFV